MADRITERPDPNTDPKGWRQYWEQEKRDAQEFTTLHVNGVPYARIPYGSEDYEMALIANEQPCHDCDVVKGQLHVSGCDMEQCPLCSGQAILCGCEFDEDEE